MSPDHVQTLVDWVRSRPDCVVEDGLDEAELAHAQDVTAVRFPPVWRSTLARVHPVGTGAIAYPDWRLRDDSAARLVAAPIAGVLFDVEHNAFWWPAWGARPTQRSDALDVARDRLDCVPRLVPIRGHWYTGSDDNDPVVSVVQTDLHQQATSVVGLAAGRPHRPTMASSVIPFWTDLLVWSSHPGGRTDDDPVA